MKKGYIILMIGILLGNIIGCGPVTEETLMKYEKKGDKYFAEERYRKALKMYLKIKKKDKTGEYYRKHKINVKIARSYLWIGIWKLFWDLKQRARNPRYASDGESLPTYNITRCRYYAPNDKSVLYYMGIVYEFSAYIDRKVFPDSAESEIKSAIRYYKKLNKLYPKFSGGYTRLGYMKLYYEKKPLEAIKYFRKALRIEKKDIETKYYLSRAYKKIGNKRLAEKWLKKAKAEDKGNKWANVMEVYDKVFKWELDESKHRQGDEK